MLIFDGDYPMAPVATEGNLDLTRPIDEVRASDPGNAFRMFSDRAEVMTSLPEMRRGRIAGALVKLSGRIWRPGSTLWGYASGHLAYAAAHGQLAYYRVLEAEGEVRLLTTKRSIKEHMQTWAEADQHDGLPIGFVIGMEGADPILSPGQVGEWVEVGLRVVSLTHYGVSTYAHGTATGISGGLFPPAKDLLREMDAAGVILDLTHASDESVRQALEIFTGPILASHQNCRALVPGERQFPDEQLKWIIERGGVIGASMDAYMLYKPGIDWANIQDRRSVYPRDAITLGDLVDHIDHVCQLAGNARHAAIGGDTDGQGGKKGAPYEIDTVADYQKVGDILEARGYAREDIENIMYRNWQRFFETWLPA